METVRKGSTRIMTAIEPGVIALKYTDQWSAFDRGSSEQLIPGIGKARCACSVKSFELAHIAGLPTHFIEQVDSLTIHVEEFSVPGQKSLSGFVHGRVLPIEWVWRNRAAGSLLERIRSGVLNPIDLGFAAGVSVVEGTKLPRMRLECTTKFEPIDRHLTDSEAQNLAWLNADEWQDAWGLINKAVDATDEQYDNVGFMCPDGKLELGMNDRAEIILVDVFGTQDENRIIDKDSGNIFSKDLIRNYLKLTRWWKQLEEAKTAYPGEKSKWPPYPWLPEEIVELVSTRYAEVARRYAGNL